MIKRFDIITILLLSSVLFSCTNKSTSNEGNDRHDEVITPVTVTHIRQENISDNILLNATSVFQKMSIVTSGINGYIQKELISPGETVNRGQVLFILETREARAIGDEVVDTSLHFNGTVKIKSSRNGYVNQLNHQQGDYVMDGTQLCVIADKNSFAFMLQVPFEVSPYVQIGHHCEVILSDGQHIEGYIASKIPVVNSATQTQQFIVKINSKYHLPENLIAKIKIIKSVISQAEVLPKTAVLTNVNQTQWWVMKMLNDSIAVKVPVKRGITSDSGVQIIAPKFLPTDRILVSGNYGLPDTALVKIEK